MKFGSYWFLAILLPRGESQKVFLTYSFACFSFSSEENNSEQARRGAGKNWHTWCLPGKERVTKIQRATLSLQLCTRMCAGFHGSAVCHGLRLSLQTLEVRHVGAQHHGRVRSQRVPPCLFNKSGEGAAARRVTATQVCVPGVPGSPPALLRVKPGAAGPALLLSGVLVQGSRCVR